MKGITMSDLQDPCNIKAKGYPSDTLIREKKPPTLLFRPMSRGGITAAIAPIIDACTQAGGTRP